MRKINNLGIISPLILLSIVVVVVFLLVANLGSFKGSLFGMIFPKDTSFASAPGVVIVDGNNQPVTQITNPAIKLMLNSPWSVKQASLLDTGFKLISTANAQTATLSNLSLVASGNANEDGSSIANNQSTIWAGNGASVTGSFAGLRFAGVNIPKGAKITSAKLQVYSSQNQWIGVKSNIFGDKSGNSAAFTNTLKPSKRTLTTAKIAYSKNDKWDQNKWYDLADVSAVVQEIVNRSDWNSGNSLSLIFKGTGGSYGRKFASGTGSNSPKLLISYSTSGAVASASPSIAPSANPSLSPSQAPSVSPSPSPVPYVVSAKIAEDNAFTINVKEINSYVADPTYIDYVFSDANQGSKTVFVKFVSSSGEEKIYSASVQLIPVTTSPMPSDHDMGGVGTNSHAMGLWNPNPKYDTCPSYPAGVTSDQQRIDYIKSIHDSYKVQGPDGKWYPTWHPPVDPATGCKFGHEHGRDPRGSLIWSQVKEYFYFDANKNGKMDSAEEAVAGLPFGYTNEQLDMANPGYMRHEDHVGHKVEFANGEPDIATDKFDNNPTAGVVVPIKGGAKWVESGARCYHLAKVHQGVSTPDATMNNLHEVFYFASCKGPSAEYDMNTSMAVLSQFGAAGEFTNLCDAAGDRETPVVTGKNSANQNYPGTRNSGARNIIQRDCVEKYFLVAKDSSFDKTFSMNMYEAWRGTQELTSKTGKVLARAGGLFFDVEDASRYYWPGHTDANTGQQNIGRTMDLCYEEFNNRVHHGGACDYVTNYGAIKDIKWDDPRSAFKGIHRGMYFQPPIVSNAGGPSVWYTDAFGANGQATPFLGSVMQILPAKDVSYEKLGQTDPRVNDRVHGDGNGTVHAPN